MHNLNLQSSFLYEIPAGDLADRFGADTKFEFKIEYLSAKLLALYLKGGIRINQNVKEDVLAPIRTDEGFVIGVNGFYADVFGRKRAYDVGIGADRLFPFKGQYLRTGLSLSYLSHWINFVDDAQVVPQLAGNASQVFDRFVSGFGVEENLQYQLNLSDNRASFLMGLQFAQFFTSEHRAKLLPQNKVSRLDLYYGIKISYLLPLYRFGKEATVFY